MNKYVYVIISVVTAGVITSGAYLLVQTRQTNNQDLATNVLSETDESVLNQSVVPEFDLLYPQGSDQSDYEVVLISPEGVAPSYTYLDRLQTGGPIFRVTQQLVPDNFNLEETATEFSATDIIQIDETLVFHGYNSRDGVQSLLFTKNGKLVSIRSPQKYSDDLWTAYILSLN